MKLYKLLPVFLLTTIFSAQAQPVSITDKAFDTVYFSRPVPSVTGRIRNATLEELNALKASASKVQLIGETQIREQIKFKEDGSFEIPMANSLPYQQIWLSVDTLLHCVLYVHDGLTIELDLKDLRAAQKDPGAEKVKFGGPDATVCYTMNRYHRFISDNKLSLDNATWGLKPDQNYFAKLDSLYSILQNGNERFLKENGSQFRFLIENETKSDLLLWKAAYYLRYYEQNRKHPEHGYDFSVFLKHPIYTISNSSKILLSYLQFGYMVSKNGTVMEPDSKNKIFTEIDSIFGKDYGPLVMFQFQDKDNATQKEFLESIGRLLKQDWHRDILKVAVQRTEQIDTQIAELLVASVQKNEKSSIGIRKLDTGFGASLFVSDKASGKELLENIRNAYDRKLIIVDIWATWCGPCIEQMPYSKKLHEEVKKESLPVEFVYLCTTGGSKEEKWRNKILEIQQPGTHIFVKNEHIKQLFEEFKKAGYPTYIVIKPGGETDANAIQWMHSVSIEKLKKMM